MESTPDSVLRSYTSLETEPEAHLESDEFLVSPARGYSEEKRIEKEEATSSETIQQDTKNRKHTGRNELKKKLTRLIRSPQEFDDDVQSSSDESRSNRKKGKGFERSNNQGRGNGKGQNRDKKHLVRVEFNEQRRDPLKILGGLYGNRSLKRESFDKVTNIFLKEGSHLRSTKRLQDAEVAKDGEREETTAVGEIQKLRQ
jgi:hypothetical protein